MTEYHNCGACGDRFPVDTKHECWVVEKVQSQENLWEICPICFDPIYTSHWRCFEDPIERTGVV